VPTTEITHTPPLTGSEDNQGPGAMDTFGANPATGPSRKLVFDWGHSLMDPNAGSETIVSKITRNVPSAFTAR
jgi:hypothetical protein